MHLDLLIVSFGCGTYGWSKVQYNKVVIMYDVSVVEPYNNSSRVGAISVRYDIFKDKSERIYRPSEHPPVRGKNVKTFRRDHRVQRQNLFMPGSSRNHPSSRGK